MVNDRQLPHNASIWAQLAVALVKAAAADGGNDNGMDELAALIKGEGLQSCAFRAHLPRVALTAPANCCCYDIRS
jgi:hypothetical protein